MLVYIYCSSCFILCFVYFCLQLDLIVDLLGSPSDEDIRTACEPAKAYVRSKGHLSSKIAALYQLSPDCDDFIMHLMCQMLSFNPVFTAFWYSKPLCVCSVDCNSGHISPSTERHVIHSYLHLLLSSYSNTVFLHLPCNPNAQVAISKGMQAVQHCSSAG